MNQADRSVTQRRQRRFPGVDLSRRGLLGAGAAVGLGAAGLGAAGLSTGLLGGVPGADGALPPLPKPEDSGIEHIVVVMMENRSFDHLLGWVPGADGKQAGLSYLDRYGVRHKTHHMTVPNNCGFLDPDHSYEGGRIQYDAGKCDGFLLSQDDTSAIGYYKAADLSFLGRAATDWTTFDRYFAATLGPTYPNRIYMHAGTTDRITNTLSQSSLPTVWDACGAHGVSGNYFFSDVPLTALWAKELLGTSLPYATFQLQAAAGTLPSVSYLDPRFIDEDSGTSNDDHPHADLRAGEVFLNDVYNAITTGPAWDSTVLVVTYDEWGGFFDHVPPAIAPDSNKMTQRRGFRVPTLVISPWSWKGGVGHNVYDHTSVLKMIQWRFFSDTSGFDPAGTVFAQPRVKAARNIAEVIDFSSKMTSAPPTYDVPAFTPLGCTASSDASSAQQALDAEDARTEFKEWPALKKHALKLGWDLPS